MLDSKTISKVSTYFRMDWTMMLKKFYQWLGSKISESQCVNEIVKERSYATTGRLAPDSESLSDEPINLKIHRADGGAVLEYWSYDRVRDRASRQLYIVPESSEFATAIANSITMEYIRRS